jgi:hypothetical protein
MLREDLHCRERVLSTDVKMYPTGKCYDIKGKITVPDIKHWHHKYTFTASDLIKCRWIIRRKH